MTYKMRIEKILYTSIGEKGKQYMPDIGGYVYF